MPNEGGPGPSCVHEEVVENLTAILEDVAVSIASGMVLEDFTVVALLTALPEGDDPTGGMPYPVALLRGLHRLKLIRRDQRDEFLTRAVQHPASS